MVAGDNFWDLSDKKYGSGRYYKKIIAANAKLTDGGKKLHPGMELEIPQIDIPIGTALDDRKTMPSELRDLAVAIPQDNYDAYLGGLKEDELESKGNFLQGVDMMRTTGKTFDEMAELQKGHMESQAKADGKTVGEFIGGDIAARGYGGGSATEWNALTDVEKAQYKKDFDAIVKKLKSSAPKDVKDVIRNAEKHGGKFVWEPVDVEINGALAYTNDDWSLYAGKAWVDAAKSDISIVYGNIVHEMGGHNEYGGESLGWNVADAAIDKLDPAEKKKATGGSNSPWTAYGYMETELWAELRENPYDRDDSPSDHPFEKAPGTGDVEDNLQSIKDVFEPTIAESLVKSIWMRAKLDKRITTETRTELHARIKKVFGLDLK